MPEWCCGYVGRRHVERSFGGSNLAVHRAYRHAVRAGPCGALVGSLAGAIPPPKTPTAFATQSRAGRGIATNTATEPGNTATNSRIHFMDSNSRLGGTTPPTNVHDIPREARDARRRRTTVFGDGPAQSRRNRCEMSMNPPCGLALPVPHSSSLDFTAERNQTKGRSREIHWFGVDGGTCGPDFTDAVRPDRRQPSRLRRRSGVDDGGSVPKPCILLKDPNFASHCLLLLPSNFTTLVSSGNRCHSSRNSCHTVIQKLLLPRAHPRSARWRHRAEGAFREARSAAVRGPVASPRCCHGLPSVLLQGCPRQ